ncbi:MAG: Uncharacterized protein CEO22_320 [Candidatus Berkelbacteria bacterium Gr01-1014_85]|uniref:Multiple sugar transport system substrate-binding protein n=1 Tax=Candidatus Berkelbacteria bacterium Gr01-1014_85 TaxID=2017150 RepID=A0A554JC32_9BACT|nr:MAG: Uncharacterized protein CEO22_320 [Candidatus Berkelbacteria bacterium Gr01-1014_85]
MDRLRPIVIGLILIALVGGLVYFFYNRVKSSRSGGSTTPTARTTTNTLNRDPNKLIIWRPAGDLDNGQAFNKIIADWKVKNKEKVIDYQVVPAYLDYEATVVEALAAGKGPDIWEIRQDALPRHRDKLAYLNQNSGQIALIKKIFSPVVAQDLIKNNRLYGLPWGLDPLVVVANSDLLSKAKVQKVPTEWTAFAKLASQLTIQEDGQITRPGLALGSISNVDRASSILQLLMLQLGAKPTDLAQQQATFHLPQNDSDGKLYYPGLDALKLYQTFGQPDSLYYSFNRELSYSNQLMVEGRLPLAFNFLSSVPQLKKVEPKLRLTVAPAPQFSLKKIPVEDKPAEVSEPVHLVRYPILVASKPPQAMSQANRVAKADLAFDFLLFATSEQNAGNLARANGLISPYLSSNSQLARYAQSFYKGVNPGTVEQIITELGQQVIEQGVDPGQALDEAAARVSQVLD